MPFTKPQQKTYRALVALAWAAHLAGDQTLAAEFSQLTPKERRATQDAWTRGQLAIATGQRSTLRCNTHRHADRAFAHFEALAGTDFYWQQRAEQTDEDRIRRGIKTAGHGAYLDRRFSGERSFTAYLLTTARTITGRPDLSALRQVPDRDYYHLRNQILRHARTWLQDPQRQPGAIA